VVRRSIRLKSWLAVAAGGCVLLTACGPVQMGAAAIVGGQRITTASLATQVSDLSRAIQALGSRAPLAFPASQKPQQVLSWLVRFMVRDELGRQQGIRVSPGEAQRALRAIAAQAAQSGSGLVRLAVANGLPPDMIPALGRYQAIATELVNRLDGGHAPTSAAAQQAINQQFQHAQCLAAKNLDIKINPQFGVVNYAVLDVVPAPATLSAPQPGASASPSASPQVTPPC
jgi:hypothetical protein